MRSLTDKPFAVNHTLRPLSEEAYALTLEFAPPVISVALGVRKDLVDPAHATGSTFVQQVHTVDQAERAADAGADAIIAQGGEAGLQGGDRERRLRGGGQGGLCPRGLPAAQRGRLRRGAARAANAVHDDGNADPAAVQRDRERIAGELSDAVRGGRAHELVPFAGQTAGLIAGVEPAGEIVRSLVEGAEAALRDQLR